MFNNNNINSRLSLDLPNHNWLMNKIERNSFEKPKRSVIDDSIPLQDTEETYLNKNMFEEDNGIDKSSNSQAYNNLVPQYFRSFVSINANQAKVNLQDGNSESALNNSEGLFTYNKDNNNSILDNDKDKSARQIKHFVPDINYQLQPRYNYNMNVPEHESFENEVIDVVNNNSNNNDSFLPTQDSYNIEKSVPLNLKINAEYINEKYLKVIDCSHQSHISVLNMNSNWNRLHASRSKTNSTDLCKTVSSELSKSKKKTNTENLIKKNFSNIKKLIKDVKKIENLVTVKQNTIITIDLTKNDDYDILYNDIIEKSKINKFFLDSIFKNNNFNSIISGMDTTTKNKLLSNLYKKFIQLYSEKMETIDTGADNTIDEMLNTDTVVVPTKKVGVNHVTPTRSPSAHSEPLNLTMSHLSATLPRESTESLQPQLTPPMSTSQNVPATSPLQQQNFPILAAQLSQPKQKNPTLTSAHSNYSISSLAEPTSSHLSQLPISAPLHPYYSYAQLPLQHQTNLMSTLPQTNYPSSTRLHPGHPYRPLDPRTLQHSIPHLPSSLAQHHLPTIMPAYNSPLYQQMQAYPVNSLYPYNYATLQANAAVYPNSHWAYH